MSGRELFHAFRPLLMLLAWVFRLVPQRVRFFLWRVLDLFPGQFGNGMRWCLLKSLCKSCGENVFIGTNVQIYSWQNLMVGNNVSLHKDCYLDAEAPITIGDEVSIAHGSSIITFEHTWDDLQTPIKYNPTKKAGVVIGKDVWIGCGVRILAGVSMGERSVAAAGAVLVKPVDAYTLVGGVPAKKIKDLPKG